MTGDMRAALEMLRPYLTDDAKVRDAINAWHAAMRVWIRTLEWEDDRRVKFEARVAERIREFDARLEENAQRNLRIRLMRIQLGEFQQHHDDLRARLEMPKVVWAHEQALEEANQLRRQEWKTRKDAYFAERQAEQKAKRAREKEEKRA